MWIDILLFNLKYAELKLVTDEVQITNSLAQ